MPGVGGGYRGGGDHYAGNGPYTAAHGPPAHGAQPESSRAVDPYGHMSREYSRGQDDPYSYGAVQRNVYDDREDPYSSRIPTSEDTYGRYAKEDPYNFGRNGKEDPYNFGRNGKVEDPYSRSHKDRSTNGLSSPRLNDHGANSQYDMDHLATFTVGSKQGLLSPADGIRKLRQMEMSTGIWTMRVVLVVEAKDLVIVDRASQEEMERFPVSLVAEPTAVTNDDRRDVYNNIVLFTVTEDPRRGSPSEMHMFQCIGKPAHEVVDDIKSAKVGNSYGPSSSRTQLYDESPPPGVRDRLQQMEQYAQANYNAYQGYQPGGANNRFMKPSMRQDTDNESVLSERTDRDVQLLNHCFDDIEKFVGRLQYAAEAFRELEKRRHGRGNEKQKNRRSMGDGMLSMRARPPPAKDFTDIFQKFKLSFNLLAKLKPHIHDPNAPELVHFLFTPLSLVVEASKDPRSGRPDLAASVVAPMLTADSKELLTNCLTSKETDLWDSLGDAWTHSREEWKGFVPPYYPRFSDGWEPPKSWTDDQPTQSRAHPHQREESPYDARNGHGFNGMGASGYRDSPYDRKPQDAHQRALAEYEREFNRREREKQMKEAERQREADKERELERIREQEAANKSRSEPRAHGPVTNARPSGSHDPKYSDFLRHLKSKNAQACEATHAREGRNNKELTIEKGEIVEVLDSSRNWWKVRNSRGEVGHVPYTILENVLAQENTYSNTAPGNAVPGNDPNVPSADYFPVTRDLPVSPTPGTNLGVYVNSGFLQAESPTTRSGSRHSDEHARTPSPDVQPRPVAPAKAVSREPSQRQQPPQQEPSSSSILRANPGRSQVRQSSSFLKPTSSFSSPDDPLPPSKTIHSIQRNPLQETLTVELKDKVASGELSPRGNLYSNSNLIRTPDVFINTKSSELQVRDWLRTKGFSNWLQNRMSGLTGKDIFKLSHSELEALAEDETTRLESQITLSKKVSGYTIGKSFELDAILKNRREEIDEF